MSERVVEYVIYIKADESAQSDESEKQTPNAATTAMGDSVSQKSGKNSKTKRMLVAGYTYAKRLISPIATNAVNTVELRTGHTEAQRQAQFILEAGASALGVVETALAGGVLGGGVGALVGAAVGVATKVISLQTERYNYNLARTADDISLAEARKRAGTGRNRISRGF